MRVANVNRQLLRGAALIEFAFVLPLLLAIIVGGVYYGYAFVLVSSAQNAARLGAESAVGLDPLTPDYSQIVVARARAGAVQALGWLPTDTVSVKAVINARPAGDTTASCQNLGPDSIAVLVTIRPNAGKKALLPVFSLGEYQIPPGLDSDNGQPAVKASACAQL